MFRDSVSPLVEFFRNPKISAGLASFLIAIYVVGIVGLLFWLPTPFVIPFVIALLLALIVTGWLFVNWLLDRVAPLIFNPYGFKDLKRSRAILNTCLFGTPKPTVYIRDGKIAEGTEESLLSVTGKGPGELDVDWESAVLVEADGKLLHRLYGKYPLGDKDRVVGYVSLESQKEPFDLAGVYTRDGNVVQVRGTVMYQIQQDARHLLTQRAHMTTLDVLKRALLPRDEWRMKTKAMIGIMVRNAVKEYEFAEFFLTSPAFTAFDAHSIVNGLAAGKAERSVILDVQARVKKFLNDVVPQWGVEVTAVTIEEIAPSAEFVEKANAAFQLWLERQAELEKVETRARIAQKQAEAERDLATIQREIEVIRSEAKAEAERAHASVEKETGVLRAERDAQVKRLLAEAGKYAEMLSAQSEAEAIRLRLGAIGEAGSDAAQRIELISGISGRSMDDEILREFLRAIGLLKTANAIEQEQTTHLIQIREMDGEVNA